MSDTHFCPACGRQQEVGARFCAGCGQDLNDSTAVAPATPQQTAGQDLVESAAAANAVGASESTVSDSGRGQESKGMRRVVMGAVGLTVLAGLGVVGLLVAVAGVLAVAATWWNPKGI